MFFLPCFDLGVPDTYLTVDHVGMISKTFSEEVIAGITSSLNTTLCPSCCSMCQNESVKPDHTHIDEWNKVEHIICFYIYRFCITEKKFGIELIFIKL